MISIHGSLNVPIEHHPTTRYMVYNGYYKGDVKYSQNGTVTNPCNNWTDVINRVHGEDINGIIADGRSIG